MSAAWTPEQFRAGAWERAQWQSSHPLDLPEDAPPPYVVRRCYRCGTEWGDSDILPKRCTGCGGPAVIQEVRR